MFRTRGQHPARPDFQPKPIGITASHISQVQILSAFERMPESSQRGGGAAKPMPMTVGKRPRQPGKTGTIFRHHRT